MSLQFIVGGAGSGKSTCLYRMISREAAEHREKNFIVLVPDQFTLETQKTLVQQSGRGGILNVDVLSFHRLAYRVFEEVPALRKTVLEDMGKMMLLRKVFSEQKKKLKYFKRGYHKPGFLDECKSFLCELMQYAIGEEEFDRMEECLGGESLMACKIQDLRLIYHALQEKMGDTYMMAEELVPQLTGVAASIDMLRDSVICLDGFTGFTPTQYDLLRELLACCDRMLVTVTTDRTERRGQVFSLSTDTMTRLSKIAAEVHTHIEEPVLTGKGRDKVPYRVAGSEELSFLEEHIFSYGRTQYPGELKDIRVRVCRKEADEAAYAARTIWWLVHEKGYSYDDIAIVTGDIAAYEQPLARELERMGIRYFMDYKKSIGANAMAEYIMAFLEMVRRNMDYESTFRFLRCGLSPLSAEETDILENYVIARGRRGFRSYQQEWEYAVERMDLVVVNEYREKFTEAIREAVSECQGGKKTVKEFTEILYRLIIKNQLYERVMEKSRQFEEGGSPLLAREYKSIYRLMMELFDELVELLGTETVTFREYEELLSAGISEGLVGFVPPSSNQVMVGDVERSRLKNIKVLFFMGVNDDRIPKAQGGPGILSENERRKIAEAGVELAPLAEKQAYTEQFYLYLTLTKPSDKLYLTYSRVGGDGSSKRPAYLIHSMQGLFPGLVIEDEEKETSLRRILGTDKGRHYLIARLADGSFRKDACWWELAAYYREREPALFERLLSMRGEKRKTRLSREAAELLYGRRIHGSVTRLEQFAKCPYAHYVIFGLGLKEREEYTVGALDYGNVFHGAMEHFSHELESQERQWQDLEEEEVKALAEASVEYAIEGYKGKMFHQSKRVEFMILRMKQVMKNTVWGIWRQMKEGEFVQTYSEKRFSGQEGLDSLTIPLAEGRDMVFGGQIDRVDTCDNGAERLIKIIDYKSGQNDLSLSKVYYGLQLQLVTYMAAAMELEAKSRPESHPVPAAMLYYQMKEPELAWQEETEEGRKERAFEAMKCAGYVNEEAEILEKIDKQIAENGQIRPGSRSRMVPVAVKKDGSFASSSRVMSTEQFQRLMGHSRARMEEFGCRIFGGEIEAAPYRTKTECGCDYCGLKGICGMEKRELSARVREYPELKDEEVWEVLYGRDSMDQ
ncbi:MAG: PD-(D/E)XK nuclease family protein [Lachnospiraceae bacterium]|nr:PD-(D/E)XK nuclease family protein [Lachnospiraceae bacterium]